MLPLYDDDVVGAYLIRGCGYVLGDVHVHLHAAFEVLKELGGHARHMVHLGG